MSTSKRKPELFSFYRWGTWTWKISQSQMISSKINYQSRHLTVKPDILDQTRIIHDMEGRRQRWSNLVDMTPPLPDKVNMRTDRMSLWIQDVFPSPLPSSFQLVWKHRYASVQISCTSTAHYWDNVNQCHPHNVQEDEDGLPRLRDAFILFSTFLQIRISFFTVCSFFPHLFEVVWYKDNIHHIIRIGHWHFHCSSIPC